MNKKKKKENDVNSVVKTDWKKNNCCEAWWFRCTQFQSRLALEQAPGYSKCGYDARKF